MMEAALTETDSSPGMRARRCIVTNTVLPESCLIRFVADADGHIVPDVAARLPGRGMWVTARREILERAVAKGHFSRAVKAPVTTAADLTARVERLLVARMSGDLGLARRSGQLEVGFDAVARALRAPTAVGLLIEASDGAEDGRRKLLALAHDRRPPILDCLTSAELSLALGRENVVHAALKSGRFSERLSADAGRLGGFRPANQRAATKACAAAVADNSAATEGW